MKISEVLNKKLSKAQKELMDAINCGAPVFAAEEDWGRCSAYYRFDTNKACGVVVRALLDLGLVEVNSDNKVVRKAQ